MGYITYNDSIEVSTAMGSDKFLTFMHTRWSTQLNLYETWTSEVIRKVTE